MDNNVVTFSSYFTARKTNTPVKVHKKRKPVATDIMYVLIKQKNNIIIRPMLHADLVKAMLTGNGLAADESIIDKFQKEYAARNAQPLYYLVNFGNM